MNKIWFSKSMDAYYDLECEECGDPIDEGNSFYFFKETRDTDSVKVCQECKYRLEELEELSLKGGK